MAGSRNNAKVGEDIILQSQFLRNGSNFEPYTWDKVEIYASLADAQAETNILETIASGSISSNGTGLATYTAASASFTSAQTYFDKVFVTPLSGDAQQSYIHNIYVHQDSFGMVAPGDLEKVFITFNIQDVVASFEAGSKVYVTLGPEYARYGNTLIERQVEEYCINAEGYAVDNLDDNNRLSLIETTTMNADTDHDVYYEISALDGAFVQQFLVPKGTVDANFFDLPSYPSETG